MEFKGLNQSLVFTNDENNEEIIVFKGSQIKAVMQETGTIIEGVVDKIETRTSKFFVALTTENAYMAYVDPNEVENIKVL